MEIINLNDNQVIDCDNDLIKLTIGEYDGCWVDKSLTIILESQEICLSSEAHNVGGLYFHEEEFEEKEIVYDNLNECYEFEQNCYYGYINYDEKGFFYKDAYCIKFNGIYYMDLAVAGRFGVYICDTCEITYYEYDGCECNYDNDDDENNNYCFDCHSKTRKDFSDDSNFKIGFEVEKEDQEILTNELPNLVYERTGWVKEKDGSLNNSGFELVSPILPLNLATSIYEQNILINAINDVKSYINADYSGRCGGHINISSKDLSSQELLQKISGYLPLFYAIYQSRIDNNFAEVKNLNKYITLPAKYTAFHCKSNGILEVRIFPAVKNTNNLLWRTELLRLILNNPTRSYKRALQIIANPKDELHQHLRKIFNQSKLLEKVKLFAHFTKCIENVQFKQKTVNRSLVKILSVA